MKLLMIIALLVSSLGGCVYVPYDDHYHGGYRYDHRYDDGYYRYRG
jgi:hypothetical protein